MAGIADLLDMIAAVYHGNKATNQTNIKVIPLVMSDGYVKGLSPIFPFD